MKLRYDFELAKNTQSSTYRASYGCLSWVMWWKVTARYRERIVHSIQAQLPPEGNMIIYPCPNFISDLAEPLSMPQSLLWRHNGHNSVSNHQPYDCLLRRLFRRRSKQTSKLRVTGLCAGNSPGPVNFPHKWPVTRKMFPFDDVIMFT